MKAERGNRPFIEINQRFGTAITDYRQPMALAIATVTRAVVLVFVSCLAKFAMTSASCAQTLTNALPGVSIAFLGFTNDFRGTGAVYRFTNSSSQKVTFQVTTVEYKARNGWTKILPPQPSNRAPNGSRQVSNGKLGFDTGVGFTRILAPAGTVISMFNIPDTNVVWRIRAFCVEEANGLLGVIDQGKELVRNLETGGKAEIFSGRKYFATAQTAQTKDQRGRKTNGISNSP